MYVKNCNTICNMFIFMKQKHELNVRIFLQASNNILTVRQFNRKLQIKLYHYVKTLSIIYMDFFSMF